MINWKIIFKIIGSLLFLETTLLFLCFCVSVIYQQDDAPAFIISIIITSFFGFVLRLLGLNAPNYMNRRDAYLVVTCSWIIFSFFGSLPLLISGYVNSFTNAFFEMMSGFTTTGATIIDNVEAIPHGLLFWRSMSHWIGGLGIVFFTIAVLPSMVGGSMKVFSAEATGPIKSKLHPRLSTSAKWIWAVYLMLTISCAVSYYLCGMGLFDCVNYAMATTATGGFATHNLSIAYFNSPSLEYVSAFFCLVSGINLTLIYMLFTKRKIGSMLKNAELRFYLSVIVLCTTFIIIQLMNKNHYGFEHALRSSFFQVVSFITTTGFFNDDAATWPHLTWVVLVICMFIGGCSGSTGGGFKCLRSLMILRIINNQFKQILHPNAILSLKIDGHNISQSQRITLLSFLSLYLLIFVVGSFLLVTMGISGTNAVTIALSCISNVGPTLGSEYGPTMSLSTMPVCAKWLCSFMMLTGRLEIMSVLVIFTAAFWQKK